MSGPRTFPTPYLTKPKGRLGPPPAGPGASSRRAAAATPQQASPFPAHSAARPREDAPAWRTDPSHRFRHVLASLTGRYRACAPRPGGRTRLAPKGRGIGMGRARVLSAPLRPSLLKREPLCVDICWVYSCVRRRCGLRGGKRIRRCVFLFSLGKGMSNSERCTCLLGGMSY